MTGGTFCAGKGGWEGAAAGSGEVRRSREERGDNRRAARQPLAFALVMASRSITLPAHFSGKMSQQKKDEALRRFEDPRASCCVFLLSLKAANVGINLTAATRVILVGWAERGALEMASFCFSLHHLSPTPT